MVNHNIYTCCKGKILIYSFQIQFKRMIYNFGIGFDGSVANKLLNINEPLRIMVVREDVNLNGSGGGGAMGGGVLVAYCRHDWRTILITENGHKNFSLELMGIGEKNILK